jgi:hypothetical protein
MQLKATLWTGIMGTLAGAVLGMAYGAAIWYSPWILLNLLLTAALTFSLGALMTKLAILTVMPHRGWLCGLAAWIALVALYMAWSTAAAVRIDGLGLRAGDPRVLMEFLRWLYAHDAVQIIDEQRASKIEGAGLIAVWVIELLVVSVGAGAVSWKMFGESAPPFCYTCSAWMPTEYGILRLRLPDDPQEVLAEVAAGNFAAMGDLTAGSVDDDPHLRIDLARCPLCAGKGLVSISLLSYTSTPSEVALCNQRPIAAHQIQGLLELSAAGLEDQDA